MRHNKWGRLTVVKDARAGWRIKNPRTGRIYTTVYRTKALALRKKKIMQEWFLRRS